MIGEVQALAVRLGSVKRACNALGIVRTDYYRWKDAARSEARLRRKSHRALSPEEKSEILSILNSQRFVDKSPSAIYAILLDEGNYYCSVRTMYRILEENQQVKERRRIAKKCNYARPELLATKPLELWSWDVTKLRGPERNTFYYLYVMIDVYSRFVVGWMISENETGALAKSFIEQTFWRENVCAGTLTIHSDRGSSMKSLSVTKLLENLQAAQSFSRPRVSDDNPYSESQFKTMKQRPEFPDRFHGIDDAREFCLKFFLWYNYEHRHSGIANMAPYMVHSGQDAFCVEQRQVILTKAYCQHPERFPSGRPTAQEVPKEVWINRPKPDIVCSIIEPGAQEIVKTRI